MATKAPRSDDRVLNYGVGPPDDGHEREWDTCPVCGRPRWQLVIVPDRFHCDKCEKAGPRNDEPPPEPEPEQIDLFAETAAKVIPIDPQARAIAERASDALESAVSDYGQERAPVDEADAWIADEMPDE